MVTAGLATAIALTGVATPDAFMRGNLRDWLSASAHAQTAGRSGSPDFADVIERVKPAVIGVRARVEDTTVGRGSSPLDELLGEPKDKSGPPPPRLSTNQGSGFFISADGFVVTTNHLVEHGKTIEVVTDDNRTFSARLVGADAMTDIALLKVDGPDPFPYVRMSERAARIGEWVFAIGNPFGLGGTVTAGIVSARARDIKQANYNDFIQIDAAINRGSSGGPTFDARGDVIGVNSAIFSPAGVSVGIGFAIPADTVTAVVAQLKDKGAVRRGWVGIQVTAVTEELATKLGVTEARGALVVEPQADSPAAKAGLAAGDIIVSVDGVAVKDDRELVRRISSMAPGTSVDIGVLRKGETLTIKLTLGELQQKSRG
jgi:serine protease Do